MNKELISQMLNALWLPRLIEEKMLILLRQGKFLNGFLELGKRLFLLVQLLLWRMMNLYYQCIEI